MAIGATSTTIDSVSSPQGAASMVMGEAWENRVVENTKWETQARSF
jgi:hypothetical protein